MDHYEQVRSHRSAAAACPADAVRLLLVNLATRRATRREGLWKAIVARNYGCTHFLVDASDPERASADREALLRAHEAEAGIEVIHLEEMGSGTGRRTPGDAATPDPARDRPSMAAARSGLTVFFTGLSGAGKSTIAKILRTKFLEQFDRAVSLLDGDIVRQHLSSELGFSAEHRDLNIRRIGYVASEVTRHGGVAICAPIAPYARTRQQVREMVEPFGRFVLVHVATPLEICEQRDRKNLYARARAGVLPHFTGISDPYEVPDDAEVVIDGSRLSPEEAAGVVMDYITRHHFAASGSR